VKTVGFIFVPLYRMLMHFARILLEMVGLTGHRAKAANCQKSPFDNFDPTQISWQKFPWFFSRI
jgi:hypothetical protein